MQDAAQIEALLEFYAGCGVDCTLGDAPRDYLGEVKRQREARLAAAKQALEAPKQGVQPQSNRPQPTRPYQNATTPSRTGQTTMPDANALQSARESAANANTLEELREILQRFEGCNLKRTAKNLVFGDGAPGAKVMFIGEAPGRDEDIQGVPFVGRSGQLLNKMLAAIGLEREQHVYIANTVPWRPPGNRTPTPQESELCRPFIERQIQLVNPDVLVLLGGAAAKQLFKTTDGILKLRGRFRPFVLKDLEIDAMATLHPSYLLRQPGQKRLAWQDLLTLKSRLESGKADAGETLSDGQSGLL